MTSATAFAPLLAPAHDDSMEVSSSPAGNQYDDEVLIDYDDYGTAALTEDEYMVEDGEQTRPGTATDDMMEDAEPSASVNEEMMHDDPVAVAPDSYIEDEELIDYSDEDYQDDTQVTLDGSTLNTSEVHETENVDEANVQQPQDAAAAEDSTAHFLSAVADEHALGASAEDEEQAAVEQDEQNRNVNQDDAADELSRQVDGGDAAAEELGVQAFEADESDVPTGPSDGPQVQDETELLKNPPNFPAGLDTSVHFAPDGPQTPSDTGLHPITVRYGDVVMPLFKSRVQPDGLLKNDNLASVSLGDLLDNCRHRLAVKIGESVSADQELVLSFENMGLQVIEHSPHAFETSLEDVLEVYLSLHQNDSTRAIPPLALSLSLQLKFTSSFNILKAAAQQGQGMSKFAYLRGGADEEDYDEDEGEEEAARHEEYKNNADDGEEHYYEGVTFAEDHADGAASHPEGQEYEEGQYQATQAENQEYGADQSDEGHQDETNYEEYDEHHPIDPNDELDHYDVDSKPLEESDDVHDEIEAALAEHEADHLSAAQTAQESEEPVQPESTASSTTVRGDVTNERTGEFYYNEDFIDFEKDDLTANAAELHVDDGNDDFSALVSEDAEEAVVETAATDDAQKHVAADGASGAHSGYFLTQQPVEELDGEEVEDTAAMHAHDEAGNDADQHGQDEDPPADNLDLNEEDLPEEDLPGADDEQFDTAFDLLEGHDFENAAENDEPPKATDVLELGDDDDIGFNDDVEEAAFASNSELGKRSFDEHAGKDVVTDKQQDSKRSRS